MTNDDAEMTNDDADVANSVGLASASEALRQPITATPANKDVSEYGGDRAPEVGGDLAPVDERGLAPEVGRGSAPEVAAAQGKIRNGKRKHTWSYEDADTQLQMILLQKPHRENVQENSVSTSSKGEM
jgi:hypothetical protein